MFVAAAAAVLVAAGTAVFATVGAAGTAVFAAVGWAGALVAAAALIGDAAGSAGPAVAVGATTC
ncbi:MAG TPA: hypothetical protein VFX49_05910 [Chloroflexota bacterium]|nr:hypothetical protein [Chloroflexota bacterium]